VTGRASTRKFRVGLTAPGSPLAGEIREAFSSEGIPVSRFVELGGREEAGRLSQGDDEINVLQEPTRETVGDLDLLFLAGSPIDDAARRLAREHQVAFVDLADHPPAALGPSALLAACGAPVPAEAFFTILLPAAELGTPGIEELFAQAGDSLNLRATSARVFPARLAFNLFRDEAAARTQAAVVALLARESPATRSSVVCARVGIFHGYAASARLRFRSRSEVAEAGTRLSRSPRIFLGKKPGHAAPAEAVEHGDVRLDPPAAGDLTLDVWLSFDGLALSARRALAAALASTPGSLDA
jgi:hypothetical protein